MSSYYDYTRFKVKVKKKNKKINNIISYILGDINMKNSKEEKINSRTAIARERRKNKGGTEPTYRDETYRVGGLSYISGLKRYHVSLFIEKEIVNYCVSFIKHLQELAVKGETNFLKGFEPHEHFKKRAEERNIKSLLIYDFLKDSYPIVRVPRETSYNNIPPNPTTDKTQCFLIEYYKSKTNRPVKFVIRFSPPDGDRDFIYTIGFDYRIITVWTNKKDDWHKNLDEDKYNLYEKLELLFNNALEDIKLF